MKALKLVGDEFLCLSEDAIFYEDDSYSQIVGDSKKGFIVKCPRNIMGIDKVEWSELYTLIECRSENYKVIAGETNWGGTGFIAIENKNTNKFEWLIHLSTINNPKKVIIEESVVRVTTDLNYPTGLDFIIPIEKPEEFKIKITEGNNS